METRILLNETTFTNLCKSGFLTQKDPQYGTIDLHITSMDMKNLASGGIVTKDINGSLFKIALQDIGLELIKEIIRRSPVYSQMYYEI